MIAKAPITQTYSNPLATTCLSVENVCFSTSQEKNWRYSLWRLCSLWKCWICLQARASYSPSCPALNSLPLVSRHTPEQIYIFASALCLTFCLSCCLPCCVLPHSYIFPWVLVCPFIIIIIFFVGFILLFPAVSFGHSLCKFIKIYFILSCIGILIFARKQRKNIS